MNILVLGATGFIGSAVARRLSAGGHAVTGLCRDPNAAANRFNQMKWLKGDLNKLGQASDWTPLLAGQDMVVNCAGALQDGLRDDLEASQARAMIALYGAARKANIRLVVQISANTTGAGADTPFLATKRTADEALKASGLPHIILRPALVLGRNAHGGTALLRALAALPFITPLAFPQSRIETVSVDDVAASVADAVAGALSPGGDHHLAAEETLTLDEIVALHRAWLGLPAQTTFAVPSLVARVTSALADLAGWLGWRSPLRSTAMAVMAGGVRSASQNGLAMTFETARETLRRNPAGVQDLWAARLYLLKPLVILILSLFWLASGLIPLIDPSRAAAFLEPFMPSGIALALTYLTCAIDISLGLGILLRPWAKTALLGMLAVSASYLLAGTLLTPWLWLDPLGPFVKVVPSMILAVTALATLDER